MYVPLEFNLLRAGSIPPSTVVVITQSPSLHSDSLGFLKLGDDERAYTRARTHVQRFQRISALPDTRSFLYRASENHWNTLTYLFQDISTSTNPIIIFHWGFLYGGGNVPIPFENG